MIEVSVVVPYWDRPDALRAFYDQVTRWHSDPKYEFIIVNDGCMKAPAWQGPPNTRVVHLPDKRDPLNPSVPLNRGVAEACADIIVLTGCEILHRKPDDLSRLVSLVEREGDYAVAACWDTQRKWIQHTKLGHNTRLHWLTATHREWFHTVGGFDEDYRHGYAWEDTDFVRRLEHAGTRFIVTDDIIVEHRSELQPGKLNCRGKLPNNQALFQSKWR